MKSPRTHRSHWEVTLTPLSIDRVFQLKDIPLGDLVMSEGSSLEVVSSNSTSPPLVVGNCVTFNGSLTVKIDASHGNEGSFVVLYLFHFILLALILLLA